MRPSGHALWGVIRTRCALFLSLVSPQHTARRRCVNALVQTNLQTAQISLDQGVLHCVAPLRVTPLLWYCKQGLTSIKKLTQPNGGDIMARAINIYLVAPVVINALIIITII